MERSDDMQFSQTKEIAKSIGQSHLLKYFDNLSLLQKKSLSEQIKALNLITFQEQKDLLKITQNASIDHFAPFNDYTKAGNSSDFSYGKLIIASGQVGCLIVAGGQGTRLKIDGPKGDVPCYFSEKKDFVSASLRKNSGSRQASWPPFNACDYDFSCQSQ